MRIIGGTLKGLQLVTWKESKKFPIRPMTDGVRETVFNVLQPYWNQEILFLDLFSGSGSISMEALSRGAKEVHSVEYYKLPIDIIKRNQRLLKSAKKWIIHQKDVFKFLKISRQGPFHIIIADPPFALKYGEKILQALVVSHLYMLGTIVVLETHKEESLKENYSCFYLFSKKAFSDKIIWFYEVRRLF